MNTTRRRRWWPLLSILLLPASVWANPSMELQPLFPKEADFFVDRVGLVHLEVPVEVLQECQPDLSDLRVFDRSGKEIAFQIDEGMPVGSKKQERQVIAGKIVNVRRQRPDASRNSEWRLEVYELAMPTDPPIEGHWELAIEAAAKRFVRTVRVSTTTSDGDELVLLDDQSVFRLADGNEKIQLSLPESDAHVIQVAIEGEEETYLDPTFSFVSTRTIEATAPIVIPLPIESQHSDGGKTSLILTRPPGIVPEILRIETSQSWFDRTVEVWDLRHGSSPTSLGGGRVRRTQDESLHDAADVSVKMAQGENLRVDIGDEDSPPLPALVVSGVVRSPRLSFSVNSLGPDGAGGTLRFGGARAYLPRYDIAHLTPRPEAGGETEEGVARPPAGKPFATAKLGPIRANDNYDDSPLLSFAMRSGSSVDSRTFTHRRLVHVYSARDGASRLHLSAADVAAARPDLADLRLVDGSGKQWPYLVDRQTSPTTIELDVRRDERRGNTSYFRITPPCPMEIRELRLKPSSGLIDRSYRLEAEGRDATSKVVDSGRLQMDPKRPTAFTPTFPMQWVTAFTLAVEDGDNAPLSWEEATTQARLPDLVVVAPTGQYTLLLGNPDAEAPRYDVEGFAEIVFSVTSGEAQGDDLEANPDFRRSSRLTQGGTTTQQILLWSALVLAVVVLGAITAKVVRSAAVEGDSTAPPSVDQSTP